MKTNTKVHEAIRLATTYHFGQDRKNAVAEIQIPYITHPLEVAKTIWEWGVGDEDLLVTAVLHDTLEDTDLPVEIIESKFGNAVASLVKELTFVGDAAQKAEHLKLFATKPIEALIIKLADRILNVLDWNKEDPKYAIKYFYKADSLFAAFSNRKKEILDRFGIITVTSIVSDISRLRSELQLPIQDQPLEHQD